MNDKEKLYFLNGFTSWYETFYEVATAISFWNEDLSPPSKIKEIQEEFGRGGLYELAKELTDKFELKFKDIEWGIDEFTDYYDEIEKFLEKELV